MDTIRNLPWLWITLIVLGAATLVLIWRIARPLMWRVVQSRSDQDAVESTQRRRSPGWAALASIVVFFLLLTRAGFSTIGLILSGVAGTAAFFLCTVITKPYTRGLVNRFGKPAGEAIPGMSSVIPIAENIEDEHVTYAGIFTIKIADEFETGGARAKSGEKLPDYVQNEMNDLNERARKLRETGNEEDRKLAENLEDDARMLGREYLEARETGEESVPLEIQAQIQFREGKTARHLEFVPPGDDIIDVIGNQITNNILGFLNTHIRTEYADRESAMDAYGNIAAAVRKLMTDPSPLFGGKSLQDYYEVDLKSLQVTEGEYPAELRAANIAAEVQARKNTILKLDIHRRNRLAKEMVIADKSGQLTVGEALRLIILTEKGGYTETRQAFGIDERIANVIGNMTKAYLEGKKATTTVVDLLAEVMKQKGMK